MAIYPYLHDAIQFAGISCSEHALTVSDQLYASDHCKRSIVNVANTPMQDYRYAHALNDHTLQSLTL